MIRNNKRKSEPDLCAVLDQLADSIKTEINCISLGTIQTFYPANQTADIKLNYKRISLYEDNPKGISDYQLLVKCPVIVLNGGGGYLTFPIAFGDSCLVLFCDREIDTWFTNGGINAPQSARVHDLNDGIALVGLKNLLNPLQNYNQNGVQLTYETTVIALEDKVKIKVGMQTLKDAMDSLVTALLDWIDTAGDAPNPTTIALLSAAQVKLDAVLK